ncbi:hypothetical protein KUCAC02_017126 [Chaenocephalus aceratus]|uniref:Uncharacterized protein n=1 Tax=Chaenocephalus aceratus TaxID=36190 RepID=A0ACB9W0V3_CHAAC|nr:hypothetical protein KUCAC02_017126 [Chaenocephalus aceratus]
MEGMDNATADGAQPGIDQSERGQGRPAVRDEEGSRRRSAATAKLRQAACPRFGGYRTQLSSFRGTGRRVEPLASTQRDSPTQGPGEPAQQREKENKANLQSLKKLKVYFDSLSLPIAAALIRPQGD